MTNMEPILDLSVDVTGVVEIAEANRCRHGSDTDISPYREIAQGYSLQ